jgi:hypothetical protein
MAETKARRAQEQAWEQARVAQNAKPEIDEDTFMQKTYKKILNTANVIPGVSAWKEKQEEQAKQNAVSAARWAGVASVAQGRQEEKKNSGNWLSNLWNASASAVGSILSPAKNTGGGGLLSVRGDGPPNPITEWWVNLFKLPGEKLLTSAESLGLTYSPEMIAYMIASIEVQRKSIDISLASDNAHLGPAQLSRNELDTDYKQGFNADGSECNTAVLGMDRRIQQVLDKAENLILQRDFRVLRDFKPRF